MIRCFCNGDFCVLSLLCKLIVSVKYSCGSPDPQVLPIIIVDRYLDYFTTMMEDRLWRVLVKPDIVLDHIPGQYTSTGRTAGKGSVERW